MSPLGSRGAATSGQRPCINCGHGRRSHRYWRSASASRVCSIHGCSCEYYQALCSHTRRQFGWGDEVRCQDCGSTLYVSDG